MPFKTPKYKLEYFKRGGLYSAASDRRRFLTIDYNMDSLIGIIGVGIIQGWNISPHNGTTIRISPGKGLINGFFAESPYVVKRRSEMVIPDVEVEIIRFDSDPEPLLNPSEKAQYVSVVQDYDPEFNPSGSIENTYVKTMRYSYGMDNERNSEITIPNDSDAYIYASFPQNRLPYPSLTDSEYLSYTNMFPPVRADYSTPQEYLVAKSEYQERFAEYQAYKWQFYTENHFTTVQFEVSSTYRKYTSKVFLGLVKTRNGEVFKIDVSNTDRLENLNASIKNKANDLLLNHIHGGEKNYDPEKINLVTDIRECNPRQYQPESGIILYDIVDKNKTSKQEGHVHTYKIDVNGNGTTISCEGDVPDHSHDIENFEVSSSVTASNSKEFIRFHNHTILNNLEGYNDGWDEDSSYNVYYQNRIIGNNLSSNVELDFENKQLKIKRGIGVEYKTYYTSFRWYDGSNQVEESYTFTNSSFNSYDFFKELCRKFKSDNSFAIKNENTVVPFRYDFFDAIKEDQDEEFKTDCVILDKFMVQINDQNDFPDSIKVFLSAPYYKDLKTEEIVYLQIPKITLLKTNLDYFSNKVFIEILGNSEVIGKIKKENILYINARKFSEGKFKIAHIPRISHVGRKNEIFEPFKLPMSSGDGIRYNILPYFSSTSQGHYHTIYSEKSDGSYSGFSTNTMIGNYPVYYGEDNDGNDYYISHTHSVSSNSIEAVKNEKIKQWQEALLGENSEVEESHSHELLIPANGNGKTIYSIKEDISGNLFVGTSDGLIMIPNNSGYEIYINGEKTIQQGQDLWEMVKDSVRIYERKYSQIIKLTDEYKEEIGEIEENIQTNELYQVNISSDALDNDIIGIKKVEYFTLQIDAYAQKEIFEIDTEDVVYDMDCFNTYTGQIVDVDDRKLGRYIEEKKIKVIFHTRKPLTYKPYISIDIKQSSSSSVSSDCYSDGDIKFSNIVISSPVSLALNKNFEENTNKDWSEGFYPFKSPIKKSIVDSEGNFWAISENSIFVKRKNSTINRLKKIENPLASTIMYDILDFGKSIYLATNLGVYVTKNHGKSFDSILSSSTACTQILVDFSKLKTDSYQGHFHDVSINAYGNGITGNSSSGSIHNHVIDNFDFEEEQGHSHTFMANMYIVENKKTIYKSQDGGESWIHYASFSEGEINQYFACFEKLYVASSYGLYVFSESGWQKISNEIIYSFSYDKEYSKFLLGSFNILWCCQDGINLIPLFNFDGNPQYILANNNTKKFFGHAYSNRENSFYFCETTSPSDNFSCHSDYGVWSSEYGGWDEDANIEIYLNNKIIYSETKGIDKRGVDIDYFKIDNASGKLDFSAQSVLSKEAVEATNFASLEDASDFNVGDRVAIYYTGKSPEKINLSEKDLSLIPEDIEDGDTEEIISELTDEYFNKKNKSIINTVIEIKNELGEYGEKFERFDKMFFFGTIIAKNKNVLLFDNYFNITFEHPSYAVKLPKFDNGENIIADIQESKIKDTGTKTHEELEDEIAGITSGMPHKLQNSYLSNLLQLTQAVRYAYPSINSEFINSKFYDMHYSWNENDVLPYAGSEIDIYNSLISTQAIVETDFETRRSKKVNDIYQGRGKFENILFAATDVGLFWKKDSDGKKQNWNYATDMPFMVFSVISVDNNVLAGTSNGLYISSDLYSWTRIVNGDILYPVKHLSLRWNKNTILNINDVPLTFKNEIYENESVEYGRIESDSAIFEELNSIGNVRVSILIQSTSSSINGEYIIRGFSPNHIEVSPKFDIESQEYYPNVSLSVGSWWEAFDNETHTKNTNLQNHLVAGGDNAMSVSISPIDLSFKSSIIYDFNQNYVCNGFLPISNGAILSSIESSEYPQKTKIIESTNEGTGWNIIYSIDSIRLQVLSARTTSDGHTEIEIKYDGLKPYDGQYYGRTVDIIYNGRVIYSGHIQYNDFDEAEGKDFIYIMGQDANSSILGKNNVYVDIKPISINTMYELDNKNVLFGTSVGLFEDKKSTSGLEKIKGSIVSVGRKGVVSTIDISGRIKSVLQDTSNGNAIFGISTSQKVYADELQGSIMYIRDAISATGYKVEKNTTAKNGEMSIYVSTKFLPSLRSFVGKKINVAQKNGNSKIYFNSERKINNNEFAGGKMYLYRAKYNDNGIEYLTQVEGIISNSSSHVELDNVINWSNISISEGTPEENEKDISLLLEGAEFMLVNSDNRLELDVIFNESVKNNTLSGFVFSADSDYRSFILPPVKIYSNNKNIVLLEPINFVENSSSETGVAQEESEKPIAIEEYLPVLFKTGARFSCDGTRFDGVSSFNNKKTSNNFDHYHDVDMIGQKLTGEISSMSIIENQIYIGLTKTNGFDHYIVVAHPNIVYGETVEFKNPLNPSKRFNKSVSKIEGDGIYTIDREYGDYHFDGYNVNKISVGWRLTIDLNSYGKTINTHYDDFKIDRVSISQTALIGTNVLHVNSTENLLKNQKVYIVDNLNNKEFAEIDSVGDDLVVLKNNLMRTFFVNNLPYIQTLTDSFGNDHYHLIRKNRVESKVVKEYLPYGYSSSHYHKLIGLIGEVMGVHQSGENIYVCGNSSVIYESNKGLNNWVEHVDVNPGEKETITKIKESNGNMVSGTNSGIIHFESGEYVPIEKFINPII